MLLEERYVDFLCENKLTQGQFLLLYLHYKERKDLIIKYKNSFPSEDGSMIGKYWIDDLFTRGFLERITINNKEITQTTVKFRKLFCNPIDVAEELVNAYPSTMEIDGKIVPLTAVETIIVAATYGKAINDSIEEHLEVLKDVKYGIENNMLNIGLKSFINSKYWFGLRKKRKMLNDETSKLKQSNTFG